MIMGACSSSSCSSRASASRHLGAARGAADAGARTQRVMSVAPALQVEDCAASFGGLSGARRGQLRRGAARAARDHRAQRRGQDDALQRDQRRACADARARRPRGRRRRRPAPDSVRAPGAGAHLPAQQPVPRARRLRERAARRAGARAAAFKLLGRGRRAAAAPPTRDARGGRARRPRGPRRRAGARPLLRRAAPARDRRSRWRSRPRVLLLDEPTAGMSPAETAAMVETIAALPRDAHAADHRARHGRRVRARRPDHRAALRRGAGRGPAAETVRGDPRVRGGLLGLEAPPC